MKQTVNATLKYATCVALNPAENSTIDATKTLGNLLSTFGTVNDIYVQPLSAGSIDNKPVRYSLAEMLADGLSGKMPLMLYLDFIPVGGGPAKVITVGLATSGLRSMQNNAADALAQIIGGNQDTVLAGYTRAKFGNVVTSLNVEATRVITVEDEGG